MQINKIIVVNILKQNIIILAINPACFVTVILKFLSKLIK